ncbi:hypothetical protein E1211_17885 [Micromonospora sp. 15K316]|uniref:hypothetical protein n=1 Tax=Micromonospora sp. 15K316 TaxID=2530376 RepID=UPI00104EBB61|nr:hypothetical protein [Micromonospora sp. 15K316]TDC34218.1 hypothetical protein E1211_17885 [Micromonospora sp. 15K316]
MDKHRDALTRKGRAYVRAKERADKLVAGPRDELVQAAREAYADGMKKADILRAMGHAWSTTWLDTVLKDVQRKPKPDAD